MQAAVAIDYRSVFARAGEASAPARYGRHDFVYRQGDPADAMFYVEAGLVKIGTLSSRGKEAVIGLGRRGDFFGEGCLAGASERTNSAAALTECRIARFSRGAVFRLLRDDPVFSESFMAHLIARNLRYEEDLSDLLSNSSEKRLARVLLQLGQPGYGPDPIRIDQQTLAEMVGTTRARVCFFMNKFRRLGFIDYSDGLKIHRSLERVIALE